MVRVRLQQPKVAAPDLSEAVLTEVATLCYFYPQYTFKEALRLPRRTVNRLLKVARKEKAREYLELLAISTAPHTKGGKGVGKLETKYKEDASG